MPKEAIVPRLRPEEFGMFAAALRDDQGFPQTFGVWLDRTFYGPHGRQGRPVEIAFDEFMAYCSRSQARPDVVVLEALASSKFPG